MHVTLLMWKYPKYPVFSEHETSATRNQFTVQNTINDPDWQQQLLLQMPPKVHR